jgi:hypothetical protein
LDPSKATVKKLSVVATSSSAVEAIVNNAVLGSNGKLARSDFDERHVRFMQELPEATVEAACTEFAAYHKLAELRSKGSYFMGILRRHASGEIAPPPKSGTQSPNSNSGFFGGKKGGKGKGKGKGRGAM